MRTSTLSRKTAETEITLSLNLDGTGTGNIQTGVGFMDHMLTLLSKHSRIDLDVTCKGDLDVDAHHSVEDIGIVLGEALKEAQRNNAGLYRYRNFYLPMDEALVLVALDLSGRSFLSYQVGKLNPQVGTFDTELVQEFLLALTRSAGMTLHVHMLSGENTHHILEAIFKGLGRALRQAVSYDEAAKGEIPSTKGVLA